MFDADVAIIGAGPAGCSAAITLLDRGYSVVIVAGRDVKKRPTETSTPKLKQLLLSLGAESVLSACEPCFGIVSNWGRNAPILQPSITSPFGHAWFIQRLQFDTYLRQIARERGAVWIDGEAGSIDFEVKNVQVQTTTKSVHTLWAILATGSPAWAARVTRQQPINIDKLTAFWAELPVTLSERFLTIEVTDHGWWYMCPGKDSTFACFVTDAIEARSTKAAQAVAWNKHFKITNIGRQIENAINASAVNTVSANSIYLPFSSGQAWIAAGDAAIKLDPLGSSGTMTALDSGRRAGSAVAEALKGDVKSIEKYGHWKNQLIEQFVRHRQQHYALEAVNHRDGFWSRRT